MRLRLFKYCIRLLLWIVFLCVAGFSQQSYGDLEKEIEALKQGQQSIRKELQEIKELIRAAMPEKPSAPRVVSAEFELPDNPVLGETSAPLTLVEFTDYE